MPDKEVVLAALEEASDAVIRGICNAAVNARQGEAEIPVHLKPLFRQHSNHIDNLIDRRHPVKFKKRLLLVAAPARAALINDK